MYVYHVLVSYWKMTDEYFLGLLCQCQQYYEYSTDAAIVQLSVLQTSSRSEGSKRSRSEGFHLCESRFIAVSAKRLNGSECEENYVFLTHEHSLGCKRFLFLFICTKVSDTLLCFLKI